MMRAGFARLSLFLLAFVFVFSLGAFSCGGEDFSSGGQGSGGGGGAGAGGSGGSGAAPSGSCPDTLPSAGTACSREGLLCTYGSDARPKCRTHAQCTNGSFNIVKEPAAGSCSTPPACELPLPIGKTCLTLGDECTGSDGYCACTCVPGCTTWTWKCPAPTAGCPPALPNAGTPCGAEGISCTYGVCDDASGVRDQVTAQCSGGAWAWTAQCLP